MACATPSTRASRGRSNKAWRVELCYREVSSTCWLSGDQASLQERPGGFLLAMTSAYRVFWVVIISIGLALSVAGGALAAEPNEGAKVYQHWCSGCHGDRGQGLTEEWRATWPEGKQNCWQAKCHSLSHPSDGFAFPKEVPAVIGSEALGKFASGQDLYAYTRATMPYWSPTLLSDDQYRAITEFLVEANYAERGLSPPASLYQDLASVPVHPVSQASQPLPEASQASPQAAETRLPLPLLIGVLVAATLLGLAAGVWAWRRRASRRQLAGDESTSA